MRNEAFLFDLADVSGVQPPVGVEHLGGRLLVAPVAGEDLATLEQQLAVIGDPHGRAGDRPADTADLLRIRLVDGQCGCGLGQAVALEDGQPDAAVEMAEAVAQRRAAGDGVLTPAAEGRAELAVDEAAEQGVLRGHPKRHASFVLGPGPGDRRLRNSRPFGLVL
jgi:hypothetical protein